MKPLPSIKVGILIVAGTVLVGAGVTMWAQGTSSSAKERYQKLEGEVPAEGELRKQLEASQLKVDDYKNQLQHLEQGVPSLAYVPTLLTELETLGKVHSIEVTGVRPILESRQPKNNDDKSSGSAKKPAYQEMTIEVTGRGTYENVNQMVEGIKKFPKIIAIQTVTLQPHRENSQTDKAKTQTGFILDTTIRLKAYLFPTPNPNKESGSTTGATS